jgi:hypothetical protein
MAFQDYSNTPASNTEIGDGPTFIGPNMPRDNVRPALQQLAADGRDLYDTVIAMGSGGALPAFIAAGTGAVSRSAQSKMRDIISVKDFGAVGDGVTDDTAAIQTALDRAALGVNYGISVFIPPGKYRVTDTLTIDKSRVRLFGAGDESVLYFDPPSDEMVMLLVQNADPDELIGYITLDHFAFISNYTGAAVNYNKTGIKLIDASTVLIHRVNILDYSWQGGTGLGSIGLWFCGRDTHIVRDCVINADQPIVGDLNPNSTTYVFDGHSFYALWLYTLKSTNYAIHFEPGCIPSNWKVESNTNAYGGAGGIYLNNQGASPVPETPSMIHISQFRCESGTNSGGAGGGYGIFMDFGTGNPAAGNITIEHFSVNDPSCNGIALNRVTSLSMKNVNIATGGTALSLVEVNQCEVFSLGISNNAATVVFTDMEARVVHKLAGAAASDKSIAKALYVRNAAGTAPGYLAYENGVRKWQATKTISNAGTITLPALTAGQSMLVTVVGDLGAATYHFNFTTATKVSGPAAFDVGGVGTVSASSNGSGTNTITNVSAGASKVFYVTSVGA